MRTVVPKRGGDNGALEEELLERIPKEVILTPSPGKKT
jgi:hypothetical protein